MNDRAEADTVAVRVSGGIAWVKFNRPEKRNCMSPKLNRQMLRVLTELEFRDDVGVLVLSGEGSAWSAGMDLKEYFRETEAEGLPGVRRSQREAYAWWERVRWFQKVTIAMVNGWCFGGAYGPLFACDLAFCSDEAQFGLSEINWGILPGGGASKVAVELMPMRKAMYHALLGENLTGRDAAAAGLVNESLPADRLEARVTEVAQTLSAEELGHPQGHQGCDPARSRDELRQRRGLSDPCPGSTQLPRQIRRSSPWNAAIPGRQVVQARTRRLR